MSNGAGADIIRVTGGREDRCGPPMDDGGKGL